jgi:hypothetical protein
MNKLKWKYDKYGSIYRSGRFSIVKPTPNLYNLAFKDAQGFNIGFSTKRLKTAKQIAELIEGEK